MNCKSCGSDNVEYTGVDDGGGDYGTSVCDQFQCEDCGHEFEANCIDFAVDGEDDDGDDTQPLPPIETDDDPVYADDNFGISDFTVVTR